MFQLEAYDKHSDELAEEIALPEVDLAIARQVLGADAPDVGYNLYPVSREVAARLRAYTTHAIDLDRYDYFLIDRAQ
jgi:hypothetical protein